jgi:octaheme c-type cytochrome (tetrathionate reductase family)
MNNHVHAPVEERFLSPGVMVMLGFMAVGFAFAAARFLFGIGAVSNLSDQFPWGIWVAIDVACGVALAAGGFTTGAIAYVFNRDQYHAVIRPALLTAMLGYTFVILGLFIDIGRYWNMWRPMISHNPNSVLFEVAMCVMIYSNVLYIEFIPIVVERFKGKVSLPGPLQALNDLTERVLELSDRTLGKIMFIFIIAGIVLSCMHQSGLGSLVLVAKYKIHPLWYTPILPLLFLLSAFAGGYPMVAFESIIVAKSFGRKPEMEILTPLAKFMPILMGVYLSVKIGDMIVRKTYVYLLDGTVQTNAFVVEVLVGVILPFVLLLFRRVRRSPGWLFFASTIFVVGILLNRINVFLVSYTPPYVIESYFPALGEIFITIGLVASLMFTYRVCVAIFPVLGSVPRPELWGPMGKWPMVGVLMALSVLFSPFSSANGAQTATAGKTPITVLKKVTPSIDDAPKLHILDSPIIKEYSDLYEPVRFMHSKHANVLGDCTVCHHMHPREEGDKDGEPVTMERFREMKQTPKGCVYCHEHPFDMKHPNKPGLKGAYHQFCMDCHEEAEQAPHIRGPIIYSAMVRGPSVHPLETRAPTDCLACHPTKVPDHKKLVKLEGEVDALTVTKNCLSCHELEGKALLESAHWRWQGPSPYTLGHEMRIDLGKRHNIINNFAINLNGNWPACTSCHIGYGWKDQNFDFTDMTRIDCLVCHDTTGTYQKELGAGGYPEKWVDLIRVAENVGRPSRHNCGINCHFRAGGVESGKHGDMDFSHVNGSKYNDVHLGVTDGGLGFRCQACHKTRNHMIAGRSVSAPVVEGDLACENCHTDKPHIGRTNLLVYHLNKHTDHVACQTCHIPIYAKAQPTMVYWDWSTAGQDINAEKDEYGAPTYDKMKGSLQWKKTAKPAYFWYNGTVKRYILGDRINENGVTELTRPVGSISDPASKIYPFKLHGAKQISDAVHKYLITPQLSDGYWKHWDWDKAARDGMKYSGLEYSGEYEFVETVMYWGLTHEVAPKEWSLTCAQCHDSFKEPPYCGRCHPDDYKALIHKGIDFRRLAEKGMNVAHLIDKTDYIDFKALGYEGDPIELRVGGRFEKIPAVRKQLTVVHKWK